MGRCGTAWHMGFGPPVVINGALRAPIGSLIWTDSIRPISLPKPLDIMQQMLDQDRRVEHCPDDAFLHGDVDLLPAAG